MLRLQDAHSSSRPQATVLEPRATTSHNARSSAVNRRVIGASKLSKVLRTDASNAQVGLKSGGNSDRLIARSGCSSATTVDSRSATSFGIIILVLTSGKIIHTGRDCG